MANEVAARKPPHRNAACFHCQQAAEKYLKALLQELGLVVPRTHILNDLLDLLLPHDATLAHLGRAAKSLTPYAVGFRYPGVRATTRRMQAALRQAERMRRELRSAWSASVNRSIVIQDRADAAVLGEQRIAAVAEQVQVEVLVRLLLAVAVDGDGNRLRRLTGVEGQRAGRNSAAQHRCLLLQLRHRHIVRGGFGDDPCCRCRLRKRLAARTMGVR